MGTGALANKYQYKNVNSKGWSKKKVLAAVIAVEKKR